MTTLRAKLNTAQFKPECVYLSEMLAILKAHEENNVDGDDKYKRSGLNTPEA